MFSDAWEATEELPPEERTSEPALVIRLQILTALAQWDLGEHSKLKLAYEGVSKKASDRRRCSTFSVGLPDRPIPIQILEPG
ncbi:MAG: hypothetical protein P1U58_18760, partial [Verrucomicrobiales bacterium]|nr:hypothetical protein [Verrucomicrobiales bacterium]